MQKYQNIFTTGFLQKWLFALVLIVVIAGIYWANQQLTSSGLKSTSDNQSLQCNFVNSQCRLQLDGQPATARFNRPPAPEEQITMTLSLPPNVYIEEAWIEGINMYMGKIPVVLDKKPDNHWQGWFMLGSCSEPTMQWRMVLTFKGQSQPAFLTFTTRNTQ